MEDDALMLVTTLTCGSQAQVQIMSTMKLQTTFQLTTLLLLIGMVSASKSISNNMSDWDPLQIEFLNISGSVLNPDYPGLSPSLRFLLYFPGNSIYGGDLAQNMKCGNATMWSEDIPVCNIQNRSREYSHGVFDMSQMLTCL